MFEDYALQKYSSLSTVLTITAMEKLDIVLHKAVIMFIVPMGCQGLNRTNNFLKESVK